MYALVAVYILVCAFGEGYRLRETYSNVSKEEHTRLQILWHWLGWLRHSIPLFVGWFAYLVVEEKNFQLPQFIDYLEFLGVVGAVWWWVYDGVINTLKIPVKPWHYISQTTDSQLDKYGWLPKLALFVISLILLIFF